MTMLHPAAGGAPATGRPEVGPLEPTGVDAPSRLRGRWPFAAFVAGPALFVFTMFGLNMLEEKDTEGGALSVYEKIKDLGVEMHVGMVLAFVGATALALFAQGFVRFLDSRTPAGSGAGSLARLGVTSAVGLAVLVASMKAVLRGGLPDHGDSAMYADEAVVSIYTLVDQLQFTSLWPLTFAMAAVAALAFRHRSLPRWYGGFSAVVAVATVLMALVPGLPYFAGIAAPFWGVASGVVVLRHRTRPVGVVR